MTKSHDYKTAEDVKKFIVEFSNRIKLGHLALVENDYTIRFPKLTEQYFSNTRWPSVEAILPLVGEDAPEPLPLDLPCQWLWDIIDEFIYQFQKFTIFRSRPKHKPEEEVLLKENLKVWSIHSVLNVLHKLVEKSNIIEQLKYYATSSDPDLVAGPFGLCPVYKMLGFFSLIGLCRLHVLLGDYFKALSFLKHIDLSRLDIYHDVSTCHITTGYYVGFACMMMHRYQDAIRVLALTLNNVPRVKTQWTQLRPDVVEYVVKQSNQMSALLSICYTLNPMPLDQSIDQLLKDKFSDTLAKLQRMDVDEFVSSFELGCPKFISPEAPVYSTLNGVTPDNQNPYLLEPQRQQVEIFRAEISQQLSMPRLRSYLRLYTTLPTAKLSGFLDMKEADVHMALMCFKQKLRSQMCTGSLPDALYPSVLALTLSGAGTLSSGGLLNDLHPSAAADLDFFVDAGMIHVADTKIDRPFSEFFIRQIEMLQQLSKKLDGIECRIHDAAIKH